MTDHDRTSPFSFRRRGALRCRLIYFLSGGSDLHINPHCEQHIEVLRSRAEFGRFVLE